MSLLPPRHSASYPPGSDDERRKVREELSPWLADALDGAYRLTDGMGRFETAEAYFRRFPERLRMYVRRAETSRAHAELPTGVVGVVAPQDQSLLGLVSRLAPVIVSGNTAVVLASERSPLPAVSLGEVLATSDVPGGVVNILTGSTKELVPWLAGHMDVNGLDATGVPGDLRTQVEELSAENVKRVHRAPDADPFSDEAQSPYEVTAFVEYKTVWHPMGA
jgi:acyl-CoA reductase-like NAD-dependent aldehyde dehydrogenase